MRGSCPVALRKVTRSGGRDRCRHGVDQRMEVQHPRAASWRRPAPQKPPAVSLIAANGVTEPGTTPRCCSKRSADPNETRLRADPMMDRFQVDRGPSLRRRPETARRLVLQEQVLGVSAGDLAAQRLRLATVNSGGWVTVVWRDAQAVEKGEQILRGGGHGRAVSAEQPVKASDTAILRPLNPRALAEICVAYECAAPADRKLFALEGGFWHRRAVAGAGAANSLGCGCSSGVEHNLAKVGVEGSNPFARSRAL